MLSSAFLKQISDPFYAELSRTGVRYSANLQAYVFFTRYMPDQNVHIA